MVSGSSAACQDSLISSERENSRLLLGTVSRQHRGITLDHLIGAAPEFPSSARDSDSGSATLRRVNKKLPSAPNCSENPSHTHTHRRPTWWTVPSISTGMIKSALLTGCWDNRQTSLFKHVWAATGGGFECETVFHWFHIAAHVPSLPCNARATQSDTSGKYAWFILAARAPKISSQMLVPGTSGILNAATDWLNHELTVAEPSASCCHCTWTSGRL